MPKMKSNIHLWTWYRRTSNGKIYLCTSSGWSKDETGDYFPTRIELLEFQTCVPKPIKYETMMELLTSGELIVTKLPF